MLITPHAHELDVLIAEFWPVALDLTHSTYPTYTDGIKKQADFAKTVHRAASEDWGEVLVHLWDGEVNGLLVVDVADNAYVSLHVCLTHAHQAECLGEALAYLRQMHAGKTLWLGFAPENAEMLAFAEVNGFSVLDDTVNWNISLATWQPMAPERPVSAWMTKTMRLSGPCGRTKACTGTLIASGRLWNGGCCSSPGTGAAQWPAWMKA